MALTLDSAKEISWTAFKEELDSKGIEYTSNESKGILVLQNNSRIRLFGVNSNYKEMKKILGQKLRRVVIDEAGSMTIDMEQLIYQMIRPALADLNGDIVLAGTCENIPNTFFEAVTTNQEPGWDVYKWTTYDNPYMKAQWEIEVADLIKRNPKILDTSWYKTHYLNEWVTDDNLRCYVVSDYNLIDTQTITGGHYILGVDLGYNDDSAFVVAAYSDYKPFIEIVLSVKSKEMDITDVANKIKQLNKTYNFDKMVIDGANKQAVEEMKKRHNLPLTIAEKTEKADFIRLMRDDIIQGRIKFVKHGAAELIKELNGLMWLDENKIKTDHRCQDHLHDGCLYLWRTSKHYIPLEEPKNFDRNSDEFMREHERRLANKRPDERTDW